jgi:hypothetical protein
MAITSRSGKTGQVAVKSAASKKSAISTALEAIPKADLVAKTAAAPPKSLTLKKSAVSSEPKPSVVIVKATDVSADISKEKSAKTKKPKLVRDSYTIPESEHKQLAALKERCLGLGKALKKSELLRAGIHALVLMSDAEFLAAVSRVKVIKTGRPNAGA